MDKLDLQADVLVIGGGSAGCMAAIAAKKKDPSAKVLIIEKGHISRSGSIAMGMDGLNIVCQPGKDSPELYLEASRMACEGVLDRRPSEVMAERSYGILKKLESWGVRFPKREDGEYRSFQVHPKGRFLVEMDAPDLKLLLARKVREAGVEVVNRAMVTDLIVSEGKIIGAVGFGLRDGRFFACSAKAVILANGGAARFGLPNSGYLYGTFDYPGNAGDGYAMAFRAGAQLTGFEYTICMPLIKDLNCPLLYITLTRGAQVMNGFGERIDISGLSAQAMLREIREGRGPVFIKLDHLPEGRIREIERILFSTERPLQQRFWERRGVDFRKDMIELGQTEYQLCGGHGLTGVRVNENTETRVPGLYAAGDVACVPRQHLTGAFVFGEIAGARAVAFAQRVRREALDEQALTAEGKRIFDALDRIGSEVTPTAFEYKVRRVINDYLAPPKNRTKLQRGLWWMRRFRKELPAIKARDPHELGRLIEISFILDCGELSAVASLERKESRWGWYHYRSDYPERDDQNWLGHTVLEKGERPEEIKSTLVPLDTV